MKQPSTMGELRQVLAAIMVGVVNGDVKNNEARTALTAATRITENYQAELRAKTLAQQAGQVSLPIGETPINKQS